MTSETPEPAPSITVRTVEDYLRTRVDFKIDAYRKKGDMYRCCYLSTSAISAIAAATVPVLINLPDLPSIYPTLLSLLVTVLVGIEGIFHWREHWKNYDLMKSFLRREVYLFQAKAGEYSAKSEDEAFRLLVERVEEEIAKERMQTIQMRTAHTVEQHKPNNPPGVPQHDHAKSP